MKQENKAPLGATNAVDHNEPAHHPTHRKPTTGGGFSIGETVGGGSEAKSTFVGAVVCR
jgi:hypothetical protein